MSLNIDGKHMLIKSKEVTKLDRGFEATRAVNQSRNHIGHIGLEMKCHTGMLYCYCYTNL